MYLTSIKIISLFLLVSNSICSESEDLHDFETDSRELPEERYGWQHPEQSYGGHHSRPEQNHNNQHGPGPEPEHGPSEQQCSAAIYQQCNRRQDISEEQLNQVLAYLNITFTTEADIPPETSTSPICSSLRVRRDWKCLTVAQRRKYVAVWEQLYNTGEMARLTDLYTKYSDAWTQTAEFLPACRWFAYEIDRLMLTIDPSIGPMPYWCPWSAGAHPDRSIVWNTFGRSGNYSNGYCARGGIYDRWDLVPCMKYQWSPDGSIYPWATCEFDSYVLQFSQSYSLFYLAWLSIHFQPLVSMGGMKGQLSYNEAPYNMLYYMTTLCECEVRGIKWQLNDPIHLTPLSYNELINKYDESGDMAEPDILSDTLTGTNGQVSIRELFWLGFGNLCAIPDELVPAILNIINQQEDELPTAFRRMHPYILSKYFQSFYLNRTSALMHNCEEIGDCNPGPNCRPVIKPTFLQETQAGNRVLQVLQNFGSGLSIESAQQLMYSFYSDLNKVGYCSPYV